MFVKCIDNNKASPPPPFKRIRSTQPNPNKTTQPASLSDDSSQLPTLDLSSKNKSIKRELPPVAFTNAAHIYQPVNNLTIKERKRAPAICGIVCGFQKYRLTEEAAASLSYARHNSNHNKIGYNKNEAQ